MESENNQPWKVFPIDRTPRAVHSFAEVVERVSLADFEGSGMAANGRGRVFPWSRIFIAARVLVSTSFGVILLGMALTPSHLGILAHGFDFTFGLVNLSNARDAMREYGSVGE